VWASDSGSDTAYRLPAIDPDPAGGQWHGFSGPWRGGLFTSLEGSNRTPCLVRWPGKVPVGRVSNELVHQVDCFTTLVRAGGGTVPADRQIDGMDMSDFLLGGAGESGRDIVLCLQGNRLQAAKWHQWKVHLFRQDDFYSTVAPNNLPLIYNLEWDPREEHQVDFPHAWVLQPIAVAARRFLLTLAMEPPIKPGTPDPCTPPPPGEWQSQTSPQIGPVIEFVTSLVKTHDKVQQPDHGIEVHQAG
jgi:arylsulfatase A-like enzyme